MLVRCLRGRRPTRPSSLPHCWIPAETTSATSAAVGQLKALLEEQPLPGMEVRQHVRVGQRRAGAAITLLHLGELEAAGEIFRFTDDPESLTQFIHRVKERRLPAGTLVECLER